MPLLLLLSLALSGLGSDPDPATEPPPPLPARIHNLKVLSSAIDDVTTAENIVTSFAKPGMSDEQRARALWRATVKYRHQAPPPQEFLAADWEAHDPVKLFNVYGYCMCCCSSSLIEALNRLDGREARGRILNGHSVAEVRYGGAWHMYDASLITYFPRKDGTPASVDEIAAAVAAWYAQHPGYRKDPARLVELMRRDGWMGWKADGPELLAACPFYRLGYLPARTHGWDATMIEYDRSPEVYEYGYHVGHRALLSLRPGESIVRDAGNRGLHVNREAMPGGEALTAKTPENDLAYVTEFVPGYRGGVVGNGTQRYAPDLARGELAQGAEVFEGLTLGAHPTVHLKQGVHRGVAVVPIASPYVYLGGRVTLKASRRTADDRVSLAISTNNGRTYQHLWATAANGATEVVLDLAPRILRRYAYWLKLELASTTETGAGIEAFVVENDIQHAPRALPRLERGKTTITVAADGDPAIASRAFVGRMVSDGETVPHHNETIEDLGVVVENLDRKHGGCWWKGGTGTLTVPIDVPGDLAAVRFSAQVRARGVKDLVRMLISGDGGTTWREAGRIAGPTPGTTAVFRAEGWPAGTRKALLRFELTGNHTIGVMNFRADADYRDPLAARTFRPFEVVHRWTEDGRARAHTALIRGLPASYAIDAAADPEMVSVGVQMLMPPAH